MSADGEQAAEFVKATNFKNFVASLSVENVARDD
jgi:hypothetical protein